MKSEIIEFFENQTIFLTGGSGFLGKVLIEKLLRECPKIKKIYVLMRQKKGKTPKQRLDELFEYKCFDNIKANNNNVMKKVCMVTGDCQEPILGLCSEDEKLLKEETTCVIHAAFSVRFDQPLREATNNIRATRDLIDLAKQMPKLKCFIYVSTAYSNSINFHIKEDFYDPPIKAEQLFNIVSSLDDDILQKITPLLLGKWPNTYIYSKSVTESLFRNIDSFPVAIIRPAIVINSAQEPFPGWIDNFYGPIAIVTAAGLGIVRSFQAKLDAVTSMVPVDYVSNALLAIIWKTGTEKPKTPIIYNFTTTKDNQITYGKFKDEVEAHYWSTASDHIVWYTSFAMRENRLWHKICIFWLHTVPSYIIDFVLLCLGKQRLAVKSYKKLHKVFDLIAYFSTRSWDFDNHNVSKLWNNMNNEDKSKFNFNMETLDWRKYLGECALGMRVFLLKDSLDTLPKGKRKIVFFFFAHYIFCALFWFLVYKLFMFLLGLFF